MAVPGRPEGDVNGGYDAIEPPDDRAREDFRPWRPGDPSTERVPVAPPAGRERPGFRWTEDQPEHYQAGDRVRSTRPVGGMLGSAVPAGTIGNVVSTRQGLFDEHVTVRFVSGYTEEISPNDIERKGWF